MDAFHVAIIMLQTGQMKPHIINKYHMWIKIYFGVVGSKIPIPMIQERKEIPADRKYLQGNYNFESQTEPSPIEKVMLFFLSASDNWIILPAKSHDRDWLCK